MGNRIRRNIRTWVVFLVCIAPIAPSLAAGQTTGLKEADICRDELERSPERKKDRENWERCIELYKETRSFKEGQGRAAYEIARLYEIRYFSTSNFQARDLGEAKNFFEMTIRQNPSNLSLITKSRKQLYLLKPHIDLNVMVMPIDPDTSPPLSIQVTPRFSIGAKLNLELRRRENRDLRNAREDDDSRMKAGLSVSALFHLGRKIELFAAGGIKDEEEFEDKTDEVTQEITTSLSRAYLLWKDFIFPSVRLQIGRQRFKDFRQWVYDETLDAVRIFFPIEALEVQLSVSSKLFDSNLFEPEDPDDEIINYILYTVFSMDDRNKVAFYAVNRRDRGTTRSSLTFPGISVKGRPGKNQKYWLELGSVLGTKGQKRVSGYGFDLGWTSRFRYPLKPYVTVGYAFGSGDRSPSDNKDKNFRQTGFQDNDSKIWGVVKARSYGELFEPELSNMMIGTLGIGIRPVKTTSIDILYHYYLRASDDLELRDIGIKEDPTGESRSLGQEIDLIFGIKVTRNIKIEVNSALFIPGDGFENSDPAFLGVVKARFSL